MLVYGLDKSVEIPILVPPAEIAKELGRTKRLRYSRMGSNVLRQTFADFHAAFKLLLVLAIFSSERSDDYHQLKVV